MQVLLLTIFLSLVLAAGFTLCFIDAVCRKERRGLEQQSLLPLENDHE